MKTFLLFAVASLVSSSSVLHAEGDTESKQMPAVPEARAAVQRSLPFIEKISTTWMADKQCNSCHVVTFHVWSHTAAAAHGLDVDKDKLAEWTRWALADSLSDRHWLGLRGQAMANLKAAGMPDGLLKKVNFGTKNFTKEPDFLTALEKALGKEDFEKHKEQLLQEAKLPNNGGGADTLAQFVLGRKVAGGDNATDDSYNAVRALLLEWQEPDGSWLAQGQLPGLQWDGEKEMNAATTMWSLLAVGAGNPAGEAFARSRRRALEYLQTAPPGKTVQTLALRLLIAHQFGEPTQGDTSRAELLSRQNADGGWSWWKDSKTSDAFATGQALYALGSAGRDASDPAVKKAWQFLIQTQGKDGGWEVPQDAVNKRPRKLNVYPFWGTAWAAIGILQTLPATEGPQPAADGGK